MFGNTAVPACRFYVNLGLTMQAVFTEIKGLGFSIEPLSKNFGGDTARQLKFPGKSTMDKVTFKRGLSSTSELYLWCVMTASGIVLRRPVSIMLYAPDGSLHASWHLLNAFPIRWSGPDLQADSTSIAFETLELAHDGPVMMG